MTDPLGHLNRYVASVLRQMKSELPTASTLRFSLTSLLALTTCVAAAIVAIQHPSDFLASLIDLITGGLLIINAWFAYFRSGSNRAFHIAAVVCLLGTLAAANELQIPPHMYICGYPAGLSPNYDTPGFMRILNGLIAIGCSLIGAESTRVLYQKRKLRPLSLFSNVWIWIAFVGFGMALAVALTHLRSELIATIFQFFTTTMFCVSLVCLACNGKHQRIFWLTVGSTIFFYLFFMVRAAWPHSYYFGPAPYLYTFYTSDDDAWVTAQSMFIWFLALQTGMITDWLFRHSYGLIRDPTKANAQIETNAT